MRDMYATTVPHEPHMQHATGDIQVADDIAELKQGVDDQNGLYVYTHECKHVYIIRLTDMCIGIRMDLHTHMHEGVREHAHMRMSMHMSMHMAMHMSMYMPMHVPTHVCLHRSIYICIQTSLQMLTSQCTFYMHATPQHGPRTSCLKKEMRKCLSCRRCFRIR